jgi:hypothetical protein
MNLGRKVLIGFPLVVGMIRNGPGADAACEEPFLDIHYTMPPRLQYRVFLPGRDRMRGFERWNQHTLLRPAGFPHRRPAMHRNGARVHQFT